MLLAGFKQESQVQQHSNWCNGSGNADDDPARPHLQPTMPRQLHFGKKICRNWTRQALVTTTCSVIGILNKGSLIGLVSWSLGHLGTLYAFVKVVLKAVSYPARSDLGDQSILFITLFVWFYCVPSLVIRLRLAFLMIAFLRLIILLSPIKLL
jgi:hypothetical protein